MARRKASARTRVTLEQDPGNDDPGDEAGGAGGGSGDVDEDEDVIQGGPLDTKNKRRAAASDDDAGGDGDETEIEIGGQSHRVDKKTALLLSAIQAQSQTQIDALTKALKKPEKAPRELNDDGTPKTEEFAQQFALKFYEDPAQAASMLEEHIMKRARAEYQQATGIEAFWRDFYTSHDDLDRGTDHWVVKAVAQEKWNEVADLPADQAIKKIGDYVRGRLLSLLKKQKKQRDAGGDGKDDSLNLETGGTFSRPLRRANGTDQAKNSLSTVINKRRLERQNSSLRQLVERDRTDRTARE